MQYVYDDVLGLCCSFFHCDNQHLVLNLPLATLLEKHDCQRQQCVYKLVRRCFLLMYRVGQNHIYTVYIRYFWQGNHQIYGHIRCIYTVLANPTNVPP